MIDIQALEPEFRDKLTALIQACLDEGFRLVPKKGAVSVYEQAKRWRQSRSDVNIDSTIAILESKDCTYLSKVLREAHATSGIQVTNDLPGFTWFNWGEAVECVICHPQTHEVILEEQKWNNILRKNIKKLKLTSGEALDGSLFMIQLSPFESPLKLYKFTEIDKKMSDLWG